MGMKAYGLDLRERVVQFVSDGGGKAEARAPVCDQVSPLVFQSCGNTKVMDAFFEKVLLPVLPPGSVIVLDNARFHQSATTLKLVEAAYCQLLFLPAYSPDLNPIEHLWATLRTRLCKDLAAARCSPTFSSRIVPV